MEEHDIFQTELIQWLGSVRNMSCSSYVCGNLVSKNATRLLHLMAFLRGALENRRTFRSELKSLQILVKFAIKSA